MLKNAGFEAEIREQRISSESNNRADFVFSEQPIIAFFRPNGSNDSPDFELGDPTGTSKIANAFRQTSRIAEMLSNVTKPSIKNHIHFAVEHPKTIKYTAERERVLRESGTETIDTTPLGFDNNTGGVGKCTYKFLKRLAAHKYPGESCDTVRRQHAWISTNVMSIQCNLFKLLRWRFDQKLRLFRRANGLLSDHPDHDCVVTQYGNGVNSLPSNSNSVSRGPYDFSVGSRETSSSVISTFGA